MIGRLNRCSAISLLLSATLAGCGGEPAPTVTKSADVAAKAEPAEVKGKARATAAQPRSYGR